MSDCLICLRQNSPKSTGRVQSSTTRITSFNVLLISKTCFIPLQVKEETLGNLTDTIILVHNIPRVWIWAIGWHCRHSRHVRSCNIGKRMEQINPLKTRGITGDTAAHVYFNKKKKKKRPGSLINTTIIMVLKGLNYNLQIYEECQQFHSKINLKNQKWKTWEWHPQQGFFIGRYQLKLLKKQAETCFVTQECMVEYFMYSVFGISAPSSDRR